MDMRLRRRDDCCICGKTASSRIGEDSSYIAPCQMVIQAASNAHGSVNLSAREAARKLRGEDCGCGRCPAEEPLCGCKLNWISELASSQLAAELWRRSRQAHGGPYGAISQCFGATHSLRVSKGKRQHACNVALARGWLSS